MNPNLISNDKVYVHFGHTAFNKDEFKSLSLSDAIPVRKEKPVGGLWASPKEEPTWQEWCACEGYHIESVHPDNRFEFHFKPDAKVISIASVKDVAYLLENYPGEKFNPIEAMLLDVAKFSLSNGLPLCHINWNAVGRDFDGIYYSFDDLKNSLGMYDCNSLIVCNPDAIEVHPYQLATQEEIDSFKEMLDEYGLDTDWVGTWGDSPGDEDPAGRG